MSIITTGEAIHNNIADATFASLMPSPPAAAAAVVAPHTNIPDDSVIVVPISGAPNGSLVIKVQKFTSTANFGIPLDLQKIARKCRNTEFNNRRHGAVVMKLRKRQQQQQQQEEEQQQQQQSVGGSVALSSSATGIIFRSGKIIVTDVNSINQAESACREFRKVIEKIGLKPKEFGAMEFKVRNIMATCQIGFQIRLEELSYSHSDFVSYEPEVFPGLVYRLDRTEVVVLIFSSGKIVLTGSKKVSGLTNALTKLYPILVEYKKKHHSTPL